MNRVWLLMHIALVLISCSTENEEEESKIFRYNSSNNISSLDPAFARTQENIWVCKQLFSGLVQLDSNLNVVPDIASSWIIDQENRIFTFNIKRGIFFHASSYWKSKKREVTAHDFKYSFLRILDPEIASPGRWIFSNIIDSSSIWCEGNWVLKIKLNKDFSPFMSQLTMSYCSVVPPEIAKGNKMEFGNHPVGCGPFYLKIWNKNNRLIAKRNNDYHGEIPKIEGFSVQFVPNKQIAFLLFKKGDLDWFSGIESSFKNDIIGKDGLLKKDYQSKFSLYTKPFLNVEYIGFNLTDTMQNSLALRKAIHHSIDRKLLITRIRNGIGTPAWGGFVPAGLNGFKLCKAEVYNPIYARKLVTTHKLNEKNIELNTSKDYEDIALFIASELDKIGLDLKINIVPSAILRQGKTDGKMSIFRGSWIADYPNCENFLSPFYSKNFPPNGPNYFRFEDAKFDKLYESLVKGNESIEESIAFQMEEIIEDERPIVVLFYDKSVHLLNKRVKNFEVNALNHIDLRKVSLCP